MSGYVGVQPIPNVSRNVTSGVIATETNIIPVPGGFTPGNVAVHINGVRIGESDFDDTDGENINLSAPLPTGTEYLIETFRSFSVAAVPKKLSHLDNNMWEVTDTIPTDGAGKPAGYIWFVV